MLFQLAVFLSLLSPAFAESPSWSVLVKKDSEIAEKLRKTPLKKILRGRCLGCDQHPSFGILGPQGEAATDAFLSETGLQYEKYIDEWTIRLFSGRDIPPKVFRTLTDAIDFLNRHDQAFVIVYGNLDQARDLVWLRFSSLARD